MGGLFLGDIVSTVKADMLRHHQIKAVLSCINDSTIQNNNRSIVTHIMPS